METNKHTAAFAWGALVGGVVAYDLFAPQGETLSEGVDRALESRFKYVAMGAIAVTAAHLINAIPEQLDPIHRGVQFIRELVQMGDDALDIGDYDE